MPSSAATGRTARLPTGTVTFLFTDIEGSTRLLRALGPDDYRTALEDHHRILRDVISAEGGVEVDDEGDALFAAFERAPAAVSAAVAAQRRLGTHRWPQNAELRVRIGLHTGDGLLRTGGYVGIDVHRAARIADAAHGGQILASKITAGLVERALPEGVALRDLGDHRLRDFDESERIVQVQVDGLPGEFPPPRTPEARPTNLPTELDTFVGRETEIGEAEQLLATHRLVTLTGTGGVGKTRLAIETARRVLDRHPDGTWLVELASIADGNATTDAIARVVGVNEPPGEDLIDALASYLEPSEMLLVLDNCEHVIEGVAAAVEHLLERCPELRVLATSRLPLSLSGERLLPVPPLPLSGTDAPAADEGADAVALFADRASAVDPSFALTDADRAHVTDICRHLDGMPLAIELAAVRVRSMSVAEIADRLSDRFRLLRARRPEGQDRHRTLRATIDWSYALLAPPQQAMLRRVSVFAGPFTLGAAEDVVPAGHVERADVLDLLDDLVAHSLLVVVPERGGATRYRLLETIRAYGREKLDEAGQAEAVRRRHAEHIAGLLEAAEPEERGANDPVWVERLAAARDDIRQAIEWALDAGEAELALRMAAAGYAVWETQGLAVQGRNWLDRALAAAGSAAAPTLRAKALTVISLLGHHQGDPEAPGVATEALELMREAGDRAGEALALAAYGMNAGDHGALERSRTIYEELGDDFGVGLTGIHLGFHEASEGHDDVAQQYFEHALELFGRTGSHAHRAWTLLNLSRIAMSSGDLERARELGQQGLELMREVRERRGTGFAVCHLADLDRTDGQHAAADRGVAEALDIARRISDPPLLRRCLIHTAAIAVDLGRAPVAGRLLGAAEALDEQLNMGRSPRDREVAAEARSAAHEVLETAELDAALETGRRLGRDDAAALAVDVLDDVAGSTPST